MNNGEEFRWMTPCGNPVNINEIIERYSKLGITVTIGTDSMYRSDCVVFVTSICFHSREHNVGDYYIAKFRLPRKQYNNIFQRIGKEIELTVNSAKSVRSEFNDANIELHMDISQDPKHGSHVLYYQAKAWEGQFGFKMKMKPEAWAASGCADWHTK